MYNYYLCNCGYQSGVPFSDCPQCGEGKTRQIQMMQIEAMNTLAEALKKFTIELKRMRRV